MSKFEKYLKVLTEEKTVSGFFSGLSSFMNSSVKSILKKNNISFKIEEEEDEDIVEFHVKDIPRDIINKIESEIDSKIEDEDEYGGFVED